MIYSISKSANNSLSYSGIFYSYVEFDLSNGTGGQMGYTSQHSPNEVSSPTCLSFLISTEFNPHG